MRIYLNCEEAMTDIGRELKKCSTNVHTQTYQNKDISKDENFSTKEIQAFQFMIINTSDKNKMKEVTKEWVRAEFMERISEGFVNPGEAWKLRPDVWNEFLVENKTFKDDSHLRKGEDQFEVTRTFDYTYNERIQWQIQPIINELRARPETRQAIIEIHNGQLDTNVMGKKRIPCSMFYHFMIRDGKLDIIYVMRSSDFATHFQNDIWLADELRKYIAAMLHIPPGKFIMNISSLHIYKKDWDLLKNY